MNVSIDLIFTMLRTARLVTERYLSDLSDEEVYRPPAPGANPIAWQLGHMVLSERSMIAEVKGVPSFSLPESFEQRHRKPTDEEICSVADNRCGFLGDAGFCSVSEYLELLRGIRLITEDVLTRCTEASLMTGCKGDIRSYAPTWGSIFVMIAAHEMMHSGQIAVLRRSLGKPIVL
jgi:hypothetical protein